MSRNVNKNKTVLKGQIIWFSRTTHGSQGEEVRGPYLNKPKISSFMKDNTVLEQYILKDPINSDIHVNSARVYDKECNGCKRVKKDIMLAILTESNDLMDLFFTTEQAKKLIIELEKKIKQNESLYSLLGR